MSSRNTWDRERFMYERDRDRDRFSDERSRFEEDDRFLRSRPSRYREHSADERFERRHNRPYDDDVVIRDSRRVYYDDEPSRHSRHRSPSSDYERERRVTIERERRRSPSPNRPSFLRRQSSLDTFDRRKNYYHEEERYGPPARREEFRPRPYEPIPLPRSRALPPPRVYDDIDEIRVSEPDFYGDEEFRPYPERIREREIVRTKKRESSPSVVSRRSRSHRASTVRSASRSSASTASSSSSSGGTTVTVKSEYPKKGKTRIPARLVSKRALGELRYPYVEEGNTIIVLKALGQENIDDLLTLSENFKKSELAVAPVEPSHFIEERRETIIEGPAHHPPAPASIMPPPPIAHSQAPPTVIAMHPPPSHAGPMSHAPPPPPPSAYQPPPPSAYQHAPPASHAPPPQVFHAPPPSHGPTVVMAPPPVTEFYEKKTVIRDVSPARSYTTSASGSTSYVDVRDVRRQEYSDEIPVGPLAIVQAERHRSRSRSHTNREIRSEIRDLERQLEHSRRRHHGHSESRELIKAERLSSGELVLFEEEVEKIEEPRRGVRIEKDKKGRMSISVPKYR
ncbi:hypothetical protein BD289DRAFT_141754 [Coniella lustricola]|uniref:DUF8035 domain-containing protein n=1 Tax=Coniella lustricola TaxID=2025994 RepID=A0A2T2ZVD7_9PEZI|nr:hypothetical protein BD289DRAFT_141754 [Coniella lustricola]